MFKFFEVIKTDFRCKVTTQSASTCSKLTIGTLEQGVKYVQCYQ